MDRAGRRAVALTADERKQIFEVVASGSERRDARELLPSRDKTTVYRAYNVVCEFQRRNLTGLDDGLADEIAQTAKYWATPPYVQAMFLHWLVWRADREESEQRIEAVEGDEVLDHTRPRTSGEKQPSVDRPSIAVTLEADRGIHRGSGITLYPYLLRIHNHGVRADFQATISVDGRITSWPGGTLFAQWEHTDERTMSIGKGASRRIVLCELESTIRGPGESYRYSIPFVGQNGPGSAHVDWSVGVFEKEDHMLKPDVSLTLTLEAKPDMTAGTLHKRYRLSAEGVTEIT